MAADRSAPPGAPEPDDPGIDTAHPQGGSGIAVSILIPAYREAARIREPLRTIDDWCASSGRRCELVVVDDGSADDTTAVVRDVASALRTPLRLLRSPTNRGKGHALKVAFAAARGEILLFTDADLSTPIDEAERLVSAVEAGHPIAIGSRKMPGASIEVRQPLLRETLGRAFTALVQVLIARVSDATCGFKAFRADVGRDLFARVRVFDWSFDAEILRLATRAGLPILELPVRWQDRDGSKVDLRRDVWMSLVGIARIRTNELQGHYRDAFAHEPAEEIAVESTPPARDAQP